MTDAVFDWRSLANQLPDLVVCLDPQMRYLFVNHAWTRETGIRLEACLGKTSREIGLPEVLCEMLDFSARRVLVEKQPHQFDHPFFGPKGEQHFSSSVSPELDASGNVVRLVALIRNVTDRVKAEAACAAQDIRLQAFIDHGPHLAWIKDETGRHVYLSRSFERQLNVRAKDWLGKTDSEIWPADISQRFHESDQDVLRDGQTRQVFVETRGVDGSVRCWWNFKFLIQDAAGRKYVGGSGIEITEQQRLGRDATQ